MRQPAPKAWCPGSACGAAGRAVRRARARRLPWRARTRRLRRRSASTRTVTRDRRRAQRTRDATACTADAAASRSRASRPPTARRTRAASRRSGSLPPDDDAAAEAQAPGLHIGEGGRAEERDEIVVVPEAADARPEEAPDLVPTGRDQPSRSRQADPHPELPEWTPHAVRNGELEHRDRAARPHHARQLAHGRGGVVDVAEEVRHGERRELVVRERQRLGAALDELDLQAARPLARNREHLRTLVDAD